MKDRDPVKLLFFYSLAFAFFLIMPAFLTGYLGSPVSWGDALDFLTPYFVMPLAFIIFCCLKFDGELSRSQPKIISVLAKISMGAGILLFVDGHGLHLSANSIARMITAPKGSELYSAVYVYDEIISHFMWDGGVFLISLAFILKAARIKPKTFYRKEWIFLIPGVALYGFTIAVNGIEGQTVYFSLPAAGAVFLLSLYLFIKSKARGNPNRVFLFFMLAYLVSLLLFAFWGITQGGFPEFSALGWI